MKMMTKTEFWNSFNLALAGIGNDLVNEFVKVCPVDKGYLKNNIRYTVNNKKLEITMPEYAIYLEFGTLPHVIRPKNAKALHWKKGGKDFFASIVYHPGTEAQPFIRTTINNKLRDIIHSNLVRQLT